MFVHILFFKLFSFDWMELISMQGKTNFFEKRVAEYQKAGVMDSASLGSVQQRFSVDEDF